MTLQIMTATLVAALALSSPLAAAEAGFNVEAGLQTSNEHLSANRSDWSSTQFDVQAKNAGRQVYYASLRATKRFDQSDSEIMLGTYQPIAGAWALLLETAMSPTHRVLAKDSLLAQFERRFEGGWGMQAGYRRSSYALTGADLAIFGVERYFSDFRAAYTLYLGRPDGASFGPSHRLQWSYYYRDRSFIGVSAAAGREIENIFPSSVLSTQVRNLTLAGRHEFSPGWAVTYEWLVHRQGDFYTRRGLGLGIRRAF